MKDLKKRLQKAVVQFWRTRKKQAKKQEAAGQRDQGTRSAATGGAQLDGVIELLTDILVSAGITPECIFHKKVLELPGYFRPTKQWDLLVVQDGQLIEATEAKSHIGPSFGNNFNNRTEEAMGSALDLWTAYREGAFNKTVRPWLGYFLLLEDCDKSCAPVRVAEPHFEVFPEFKGASYCERYEWFCRKLVRERHYDAAAFIASKKNARAQGAYREPADNDTITTTHRLIQADARSMPFLEDGSVHLVVTSPPYWKLKQYNEGKGQLGHVADYEEFLDELASVWREAYRLLVPGGRLVCVVGDVCLSRRKHGRHVVVPLHADICVMCRKIGFDNLNPILWHKIANASYEVNRGGGFLGKPYEPNAIIKNDIEFILMQHKPGGYRKPTEEQRRRSMIDKADFQKWFRQFWNITGASTKKHPAPFPEKLAHRLVRMFSFYGDTVLDPFCGTGTTMLAAMKCDRNSIGIEIDKAYCEMAARRLHKESESLFSTAQLQFEKTVRSAKELIVREEKALYRTTRKRSTQTSSSKKKAKA